MRPPPNWTKFPRCPIVAGTILLAAAVTIAWWAKLWDISVLFATAEIRRGQVWCLLTGIFRHLDILHLLFQSLLAVGLRIPHRGGVWTCQNRRTHSSLCSRIKFFRVRICPRRRGAFRRWLWTVRLAVGAVPPRRALPRFHRSENGGCLCGVVLLHRDHTDSHLSIPTGN